MFKNGRKTSNTKVTPKVKVSEKSRLTLTGSRRGGSPVRHWIRHQISRHIQDTLVRVSSHSNSRVVLEILQIKGFDKGEVVEGSCKTKGPREQTPGDRSLDFKINGMEPRVKDGGHDTNPCSLVFCLFLFKVILKRCGRTLESKRVVSLFKRRESQNPMTAKKRDNVDGWDDSNLTNPTPHSLFSFLFFSSAKGLRLVIFW